MGGIDGPPLRALAAGAPTAPAGDVVAPRALSVATCRVDPDPSKEVVAVGLQRSRVGRRRRRVVRRAEPAVQTRLVDVREAVDWTRERPERDGGQPADVRDRFEELSLGGLDEGGVDRRVELAGREVEVVESVQAALRFGEVERSELLPTALEPEDPLLVRNPLCEPERVGVACHRLLWLPIEEPVSGDPTERAARDVRDERGRKRPETQQRGERLGVDLVALQARIGDRPGLVRVGEHHAGTGGDRGAVEVLPHGARL